MTPCDSDPPHIILSPILAENTKLYRYISFRQFMDFVEMNETSLSRIKNWPDPWEVPPVRMPLQINDGAIKLSAWNICESMFGQCWSLHEESDAMWRIYSPQHEGVVIQTSVKKFRLLRDIKHAALGPVIYYDDLKAALDQIYTQPHQGGYERFTEAFLKRKAFEHENEVRLVTVDDPNCLVTTPIKGAPRLNVSADPRKFIESIRIDPRADDRYVAVLQKYCERAGFAITPMRSKLYGDLFEQTRLVRRYVTVKKQS